MRRMGRWICHLIISIMHCFSPFEVINLHCFHFRFLEMASLGRPHHYSRVPKTNPWAATNETIFPSQVVLIFPCRIQNHFPNVHLKSTLNWYNPIMHWLMRKILSEKKKKSKKEKKKENLKLSPNKFNNFKKYI